MKLLSILLSMILSIGLFVAPSHAYACAIPPGMADVNVDAARTRRSMFVHPSRRSLMLQVRESWKR